MRMMRSTALAVSAMAFLAACSDSATGPSSAPVRALGTPSFALGDVPDGLVDNVPAVGRFTICKTEDSNVSGVFTIATQSINGGTGDVAGGSVATGGSITVAPGECRIAVVANDHSGSAVRVTITETSAGFVGPVLEQQIEDDFEDQPPPAVISAEVGVAAGLTYDVNLIHGVRLTYRNIVEIPPAACDFSTFGGFVLTPNNISYGGNAGRIEDPPGFAYGDLNFVNHTTGDHIHVWNVTDYGHPDTGPLSQYPDSRLAFGLGSVNGGPANVEVEWRFVDLGEPAKKVGDAVYLKVGGVVLIPEQVVIGGNIQLHPKCKKAPKAEKH